MCWFTLSGDGEGYNGHWLLFPRPILLILKIHCPSTNNVNFLCTAWYMRKWGVASFILKYGASGQLLASAAFAQGKCLPYLLKWTLGGPPSPSGGFGEYRNFLPLPAIEPRFLGRLDSSLITVPITLFQLPLRMDSERKVKAEEYICSPCECTCTGYMASY
jgi:hypothetical protein